MRTLALALLIPMAVCAACGRKAEPPAAAAPAAAEANPTSAVLAPDTSATATPAPPTAKVSLVSAAGSSVKGDLTLTGEGLAVQIQGDITGLAPGKEHGFHVHEKGECTLPDFTSAGAHLNPTNDPHGGPDSGARHLGDIPNIKADQDGHASIDVSLKGATLFDKDGGPNQITGKALVVHAMADDYKTQPSGNSGGRIACGVIR
jgi:superoxide dismutase, Cu-Zn family